MQTHQTGCSQLKGFPAPECRLCAEQLFKHQGKYIPENSGNTVLGPRTVQRTVQPSHTAAPHRDNLYSIRHFRSSSSAPLSVNQTRPVKYMVQAGRLSCWLSCKSAATPLLLLLLNWPKRQAATAIALLLLLLLPYAQRTTNSLLTAKKLHAFSKHTSGCQLPASQVWLGRRLGRCCCAGLCRAHAAG